MFLPVSLLLVLVVTPVLIALPRPVGRRRRTYVEAG